MGKPTERGVEGLEGPETLRGRRLTLRNPILYQKEAAGLKGCVSSLCQAKRGAQKLYGQVLSGGVKHLRALLRLERIKCPLRTTD